eukprot:jgi/Tetstr1/435113/TSEL_024081.t1
MAEPLRAARKRRNLLHRLVARETSTGRPCTAVHGAWQMAASLSPAKHEVPDVSGVDFHICRFTPSGQYLVGFARHFKELVVHRFTGLSRCEAGEGDSGALPSDARAFSRYFRPVCRRNLVGDSAEVLMKDFCLAVNNERHLLVASATPAPSGTRNPPASPVPPLDSITLHVVCIATGECTDSRTFREDYIHLTQQCTGVSMHSGILAVLAILRQNIHMYQVTEEGLLLDVNTIGEYCYEDDALAVSLAEEAQERWNEREPSTSTSRRAQKFDPFAHLSVEDDVWPHIRMDASLQARARRLHTARQTEPAAFARLGSLPHQLPPEGGPPQTARRGTVMVGAVQAARMQAAAHAEGPPPASTTPAAVQAATPLQPPDSLGTPSPVYLRLRERRAAEAPSAGPPAGEDAAGRRVRPRLLDGPAAHAGSSSGGPTAPPAPSAAPMPPSERPAPPSDDDDSDDEMGGDRARRLQQRRAARAQEVAATGGPAGAAPPAAGSAEALAQFVRLAGRARPRGQAVPHAISAAPAPIGAGPPLGSPMAARRPAGGRGGPPPMAVHPAEVADRGDQPQPERGDAEAAAATATAAAAGGGVGVGAGGAAAAGGARRRAAAPQRWRPPNSSGLIRGITHRILAYIMSKAEGTQARLRFFCLFKDYTELMIWKVQLLDRSHMLLMLGPAHTSLLRDMEDTQPSAFLAVYNFYSTRIVALFPNHSQVFLQHYIKYSEHFVNGSLDQTVWARMTASPSNSYCAHAALVAKLGACSQLRGQVQASKYTLLRMPFSSQAVSCSPYLDLNLFQFDDTAVSLTHRPIPCPEQPIRFNPRREAEAGCSFRLDPGQTQARAPPACRHPSQPSCWAAAAPRHRVQRLCSSLFHPTVPFVILYVQTLMQPPAVKLYFR